MVREGWKCNKKYQDKQKKYPKNRSVKCTTNDIIKWTTTWNSCRKGIDSKHCKNTWRTESIIEAPIIKEKEEGIQTNSKQTQVKLYVEMCRRMFRCNNPRKYIISNLDGASDSDDSHGDHE